MLGLKNAITHLSRRMDDPRILVTSELRVAEGKKEVMDMVTSSSVCLYPSPRFRVGDFVFCSRDAVITQ